MRFIGTAAASAIISARPHLDRESAVAFNAVLLLLALFVAWGRFGPYPL